MGEATIYEVARAAGVSPSTVSNLLNGRSGRMLPETRQRVEEAIARLDYRPNRAARQLRTGRSGVIGLVVPSVANPFWGTFARHLEGAALTQDHRLLLCNSERDPDRERAYLEELWADGVRDVVLGTSLHDLSHVWPLLDRGLRLVAFDRTPQPDDHPALVNVSVDNFHGVQLATRHLIELGHRRVVFVSGSLRSVNRGERHRGFVETLRAAGLDGGDQALWAGANAEPFGDLEAAELGRTAARELLGDTAASERPTALVAVNDMCALGVCAGVRDLGLRVGADVSVVGFDDIPLADLAWPALTTVRQPLREMAQATFARLAPGNGDRRGQDNRPAANGPDSVTIAPELVVRASTGPADPA